MRITKSLQIKHDRRDYHAGTVFGLSGLGIKEARINEV